VVLGASADSVEDQARFAAKCSIVVPMMSDPAAAVARAYGAYGKKSFAGKEYEGVLRSTFLIGPDGKVAREWPAVKVDGHAKEVLDSIGN